MCSVCLEKTFNSFIYTCWLECGVYCDLLDLILWLINCQELLRSGLKKVIFWGEKVKKLPSTTGLGLGSQSVNLSPLTAMWVPACLPASQADLGWVDGVVSGALAHTCTWRVPAPLQSRPDTTLHCGHRVGSWLGPIPTGNFRIFYGFSILMKVQIGDIGSWQSQLKERFSYDAENLVI